MSDQRRNYGIALGLSVAVIICGLVLAVPDLLMKQADIQNLHGSQIIVDKAINDRFLITAILFSELLIIILFRSLLRLWLLVAGFLSAIIVYVYWWVSTYQMVKFAENSSYSKIDHFAFLGGGAMSDIILFIGILLAIVFLLKAVSKGQGFEG